MTVQVVLILAILILGSLIGIAGVDLILPVIPSLPSYIGGDASQAQFVLASFAAGAGFGMLIFGSLGDRFEHRTLLLGSFLVYGLTSIGCALSASMEVLIALRFFQGAAGAAAAVFAPGFIRMLMGPERAVRAIGVMGSVEALAPGLAPIAGIFLLKLAGWRASFGVIAALSLLLALLTLLIWKRLPKTSTQRRDGSYRQLLSSSSYLRYCMSHACSLGAILTFVFGAPTVFVASMGGTLTDFVIMQVLGIIAFIAAANLSHKLVERWSAERVISLGAGIMVLASLAILLFAFFGKPVPWMLLPLIVPFNFAFGLRGPPGFFHAILASNGDDARGSALAVLAIMGTSALGTALVAPFIEQGLQPLALVTALLSVGGYVLLKALPPLLSGS